MNFSLILAIEFPKKEIYGSSEIENLKYDKIFNLLIAFLINILLFVCIKQKSKTEVRKQPFKCS